MKDLVKRGIPKWAVGLLVAALILGGGYVAYSQITTAQRRELRRQIQTATVERQSLPVTISANGSVLPERSANVSPKSSGILKQLLVKEGDRVQEGQILAYMDDSNLKGQYTQAQGQLAQAQANLDKIIAGNRPQDIAQAAAQVANDKAALASAESTFQQNQQLFKAGALAQRDLITSRAARDQSAAQVRKSQQALDLQKVGSRPEDIATARAQVVTAQGALQTIQADINDTVIRAPFSGLVTKKFADPGAFVTPSTAGSSASSASASILALASTNQIDAYVAEANIAQIKLGQPVKIKADAFPGKTFDGKVVQVAAQSTVTQNVTSFEVKTSVSDPQNLLRSGMSTHVDFNVGTLNNVLVIPTVAIVRQDGVSGVQVMGKQNGEQGGRRPEFRPITTSVSTDDGKTVVLSGVTEGERVLTSFPQGDRPQSRTPSFLPGMGGGGRGGSGGGAAGGSGGASGGGARQR
ncbi:efflux RND transporter periplasmic adaptor subunit [Stenomitos frigidus]|uniref:Efflux transporter periplasmic adaptor subunit n=1 Tax=Stenomitos frigidus ULC18 TaxID=2107698 RepID=A0A2T1E294_9CYAN|nr:efflux RND transporter periplasmic adaptor subunit [Stenomitos frigidus]PSB26872.1 efflux transporter periplasmic adaptor subunit [Stenomitos frigidus ULC18]